MSRAAILLAACFVGCAGPSAAISLNALPQATASRAAADLVRRVVATCTFDATFDSRPLRCDAWKALEAHAPRMADLGALVELVESSERVQLRLRSRYFALFIHG